MPQPLLVWRPLGVGAPGAVPVRRDRGRGVGPEERVADAHGVPPHEPWPRLVLRLRGPRPDLGPDLLQGRRAAAEEQPRERLVPREEGLDNLLGGGAVEDAGAEVGPLGAIEVDEVLEGALGAEARPRVRHGLGVEGDEEGDGPHGEDGLQVQRDELPLGVPVGGVLAVEVCEQALR